MKKIKDAEEMCIKSDKDTIQEYNLKLTKAIEIYNKVCLDNLLGIEERINSFLSCFSRIPSEAREILVRWRDMLPYVHGSDYDVLLAILSRIAKTKGVDIHERSMVCVTLYNHFILDKCYSCFESIAVDRDVDYIYRAEACRYLYGSDTTSNKIISQECLLDIIEDEKIPSPSRYKIITSFVSKSGVTSFLNKSRIRVPYDEEFLCGLQSAFFNNEKNGVRERILSGQHLLQMKCAEDDKFDINEKLLKIANSSLEENIRADAADVLVRLGDKIHSNLAREIIIKLGHSSVNTKSNNIMDRVKTLYNNSQNVHDDMITKIISDFIEKMFEEDVKPVPFDIVKEKVNELTRSKNIAKNNRFKIYSALNRIESDTATFSSKKVTLAEIFVQVWLRIVKADPTDRKLLEDRLLDELADMGDTCSSGHSYRFINVLDGHGFQMKISFAAQITANLVGRINAMIRDLGDADLKSSITSGMIAGASEEDAEIYKKFITDALTKLEKELYKEFVENKYITANEFNLYFLEAKKEWLI